MDRLLTVDDVAQVLSVSRRTAYTYMADMIHLSRPLRVAESSLREWMVRGTERPGNKPVVKPGNKHRSLTYVIEKRRF